MKKLMFAVGAAALCGAVFAEEVQSANVVGYQHKMMEEGTFGMITPTFKPVAGGAYKISDIKVAGEVGGYGAEYGQKLGFDGQWGQDYYYLTEDNTGMPTGWYKDSLGNDPVTDEDTLLEGEALSFTAESVFDLVFSGEVNAQESAFVIPDGGFAMVGNPTPVTVKIADLIVDGEVGGYGAEYCQKMGADGQWGQDYYYLTEENTGMPTGWYKDSLGNDPVTDEDVLEPGESMSFTAEVGFTLKFPSAL